MTYTKPTNSLEKEIPASATKCRKAVKENLNRAVTLQIGCNYRGPRLGLRLTSN